MRNTNGNFIDWSPHLPPDQETIRQHTFHPSRRWTRLAVGGSAQSVLHYFEQHAVTQPNHLAIQSGLRQMTYAELNQRANQIAHHLLNLCPADVQAVALLLDDDFDTIPAALAVWKMGKFFVQLSPDVPIARLAYIVEDVQAGCLITSSSQRGLMEQLASSALPVLFMDFLPAELGEEDLGIPITSEMTAVIKYTSGSTGQPKGVLQTHGLRLYDVAVANELYN